MALTQYPWLEEAAARLDAMRERLPNAILIHGMPGVGTFELARWFAERLLCESPKADGSPCGKCPGCRMMHANGHPDCRIVVSEFLANALDLPYTPPETSSSSKKLSREIRIHQFRALTDFLTMAPSRGGRRCVLVYPADMVRAEAAASLLKSMEEPPEGVLFLLTADSLAGVLPTIRSRCISFAMAPVSPADCARYCTKQGVDAKAAALYSELFDGHIGTVLAAARDDARREQVEQALTLAKAAAAKDSYAAAVLLAGYEKEKASAAALLADFRAVAASGLRGSPRSPVQGDAARKALGAADAAMQRISAQVNPKIVLSVLAAKFRNF